MKTGVYDNISNADYHGGPGVSNSGLALMRRSPLHFRARQLAANDNAPTTAQAIGTAFHALLLEPDEFAKSYTMAPKFDRRTKQGKADAEAWDAEHAGVIGLAQDAWDQLMSMRDAVMAHPIARALLTGRPGKAEQSVYWVDQATGVLCRCRPDFWRDDNLIVDLKTTEDASLEGFSKSIANWAYDTQAAFYTDGVLAATGKPLRAFVFLAVEKSARVVEGQSLGVAVYQLDEAGSELGRAKYREDLGVYAQCVKSGIWPCYGEKLQTISLPQWHMSKNAHLLDRSA